MFGSQKQNQMSITQHTTLHHDRLNGDDNNNQNNNVLLVHLPASNCNGQISLLN